jgi:hypothetical protein
MKSYASILYFYFHAYSTRFESRSLIFEFMNNYASNLAQSLYLLCFLVPFRPGFHFMRFYFLSSLFSKIQFVSLTHKFCERFRPIARINLKMNCFPPFLIMLIIFEL